MQQPLALLTKHATIFWEHEVFVDCCHSNTTDYIFNQMSHFMLLQGKFVFAIFACSHEFLVSDDASCAYQKHGGRSCQLASRHQLATDSDLLRIDFGRKMLKCDQN